MVQWLRIHLAMQGIPVRLLAWEDPTCLGATKPVHHDYLALQSLQAATTGDCAPKEEKPLSEKPTHDNEKQPPLPQLEEKAMATHSSTLAWKIPWTEEPGGLQSMGSRRVRHD